MIDTLIQMFFKRYWSNLMDAAVPTSNSLGRYTKFGMASDVIEWPLVPWWYWYWVFNDFEIDFSWIKAEQLFRSVSGSCNLLTSVVTTILLASPVAMLPTADLRGDVILAVDALLTSCSLLSLFMVNEKITY